MGLILLVVLALIVGYYLKKVYYYGPMKNLKKGTTILITGGAQGLGKLLAQKLIKNH